LICRRWYQYFPIFYMWKVKTLPKWVKSTHRWVATYFNTSDGYHKWVRSTHPTLSTDMLLLDVEKAFDSVWHKALLHKLLQRGCDIFLARLIFSFFKGRSFQSRVGSAKSPSHNITFGVPQGAILSPTLYNIFTSRILWNSNFCWWHSYFCFRSNSTFGLRSITRSSKRNFWLLQGLEN
jgi:Reverse transcriptase (RNA-dependent DNA polymerase)